MHSGLSITPFQRKYSTKLRNSTYAKLIAFAAAHRRLICAVVDDAISEYIDARDGNLTADSGTRRPQEKPAGRDYPQQVAK